jgi:2-polyprenyl-3-methyl-5-hydroxy-6-metoxy-1,4-benzoquinol methylase
MMSIRTKVQEFYNTTPFPDYELDRFNTKEDLRVAATSFSVTLDNSISENASIIDVGTGTGQLSAFLSLRRKGVLGIDFSEGSLNKARLLKEKLGLNTWQLKNVDITDSRQIQNIETKFDYVLCLGVLHHTPDAYASFQNILPLLKPGGHIAIGLYNKFGRLPLQVRAFLAKTIFKDNEKVKDYFIRIQIGDIQDKEKKRGWWNDQFLHPHETTHTVGEILTWFKKNQIEYYQTVPSSNFFDQSNIEIAGVWNKYNERYPSFPERLLKQLYWIWKTQHEGGYWITLGRKVS